jgi:CheY-like chemotaxis protein
MLEDDDDIVYDVQYTMNAVVLVVDDDDMTLRIFRMILKSMGFVNIKLINSASEALEYLKNTKKVDLIITDWVMPDISGIEFIERIRANPLYDNIPILMASGISDPEEIEEALAAGVTSFLVKPLGLEVVEAHIAKCLAWRSNRIPINDLVIIAEPDETCAKFELPICKAGRNPLEDCYQCPAYQKKSG